VLGISEKGQGGASISHRVHIDMITPLVRNLKQGRLLFVLLFLPRN
jgi:hypothetical protein